MVVVMMMAVIITSSPASKGLRGRGLKARR